MGPKEAKIALVLAGCSEIDVPVGPKEAKIALVLAGCSGSVSQGRPVSYFASVPL